MKATSRFALKPRGAWCVFLSGKVAIRSTCSLHQTLATSSPELPAGSLSQRLQKLDTLLLDGSLKQVSFFSSYASASLKPAHSCVSYAWSRSRASHSAKLFGSHDQPSRGLTSLKTSTTDLGLGVRSVSFIQEAQTIEPERHRLLGYLEECGHSLRIGDLLPCPDNGLLGHQERGCEDVGFPFGTADIVPRSVRILYGPEIVLGIDEFSFACS